jgi:hypothetical protein
MAHTSLLLDNSTIDVALVICSWVGRTTTGSIKFLLCVVVGYNIFTILANTRGE